MVPELPSSYWYLAGLRVALVLIPQSGYVHPDEYFQSIEVLAGRAFDVDSNPPWEFNATFPLRSVTIPYCTLGLVYGLTKVVDLVLRQFGHASIITPYMVVVAPRLLFCVLSFLVDLCLYLVCVNNNEKYKSRLVVLASSYVMIVYGTRTFSNTVELILFALLQYFVCESLTFSNILIKKREYLNYRYEQSETVVEKVKFHKLRLFLASDSLRNCLEVSVVAVLGFFNRPTFVAFALFPVFFWLYRGMGNKLIPPLNFHLRMVMLIVCAVPMLLLNILVDSFFYGYLTWGEVGVLQVSIDNFIFTPLNFLKYNLNTGNLAEHGLHPRFLHILVNMPLLFNVLAFFGIAGFCQAAHNFIKWKHHLLPTVRSIKGLMMLSYLAPLALLSIFPHQEPRFIIPLIVPLVYLYSDAILPEPDNILIKLQESSHRKIRNNTTKKQQSNVLFKLWLLINGIFVVFYGFLHQGGVYQVANHLSNSLKNDEAPKVEYHVVTSFIYPVPEALFLQKSSDKLHHAKNTKYALGKRVYLSERGSLNLDTLTKYVESLYKSNEEYRRKYKPKRQVKMFLVIPSSLDDRLLYYQLSRRVKFTKVRTFYPHISTETIPDMVQDIFYFYSNFTLADIPGSIPYYLWKVGSSFGLSLHKVTLSEGLLF